MKLSRFDVSVLEIVWNLTRFILNHCGIMCEDYGQLCLIVIVQHFGNNWGDGGRLFKGGGGKRLKHFQIGHNYFQGDMPPLTLSTAMIGLSFFCN